jgi:2-oxoglutarate ferredoxin oxidoreductase subunit beta
MKQLLALLKGAVAHRGTALLDVISPCVTFNNHEDSTKSYKWAKDHEMPIQEIGFVPYFEEITVDYEAGTTQDVTLFDGSTIRLKKLREDYDPTDKHAAFNLLHEAREKNEFLTGLIYVEPQKTDFLTLLGLPDEPLATLSLDRIRPGREALTRMMEELR